MLFRSEVGAPIFLANREWKAWREADGRLGYESAKGKRLLPKPGLLGDYQYPNAGTAIAVLEACPEIKVSDGAIAAGLGTVRWPARLQRLVRGPLVDRLPAGWELWLDGGHNPHAARVIAAFLAGWTGGPVHLVSGMLNTKDNAGFFAPFAGKVTGVRTVAIPGEANSVSAEDLTKAASSAGLRAKPEPSVEAALTAIIAEAQRPTRVLICGSLYLAGRVLAENG